MWPIIIAKVSYFHIMILFSQIDTFIYYLKSNNDPEIIEFLNKYPTILKINWKSTYNDGDSDIFVMSHMKHIWVTKYFVILYLRIKAFLKGQLKMLRAQYLPNIFIKDFYVKTKDLIKAA